MGKNVLNSIKQFSLIFLVLCILNHSTATARANGLETDELNEAFFAGVVKHVPQHQTTNI